MAFRLVQRSFKLCLIQLIMLAALRRNGDDFTSGQDDLASDELIDMPDETMMRQPTAFEVLQHRGGKGSVPSSGKSGGGSSGGSGGGNTSTLRKVWRIGRIIWRAPDVVRWIGAGGAAIGAGVGFARRRRGKPDEQTATPSPTPGKPQASAQQSTQQSAQRRRRWKYGKCTRKSCPTGACCARGKTCHRCAEKRSKRNHDRCRGKGGHVCATEWF
eukprot:TRINITY_DN5028_c0_g3_i1.p1 TRINITY_DN5028_c0_g3~~TRINITY_DN5028_c0_g3_i1.p1  ORF type:complete len:240 (+),score=10.30 TRINITY_DN5028_c0_g3_i1:76-720(+)